MEKNVLEPDRWLSKLMRGLNRWVPMGRRLRPLRDWSSHRYAGRESRWVVISNYRGHLKLRLDRAAYMGSSIYWHGWHHGPELAYLERAMRPDSVFIDAGANLGEFTVAMAPRVNEGRVLAFEPQPDVRALLEANIALNRFTNVTVFPFGLADVHERAQLFTSFDTEHFGGFNEGLYTRFPDQVRSESVGYVEFRSMDEVLKDQAIERVDWIKADVEGGELPLVKGANRVLSTMRPNLLLEINEGAFQAAGYSVTTLAKYLSDLNYRPWRLSRRSRLIPYDWQQAGGGASLNLFLLPAER